MKKTILTLLIVACGFMANAQGNSAPVKDSVTLAKEKQAAERKAAIDSVNKLVIEKMQINHAMINLAYDNASKEFSKYDFDHEKKTRQEFYQEFINALISTWLIENRKEQEKKKPK